MVELEFFCEFLKRFFLDIRFVYVDMVVEDMIDKFYIILDVLFIVIFDIDSIFELFVSNDVNMEY